MRTKVAPRLVLLCLQGVLGPQLQNPPRALLQALDAAVLAGPCVHICNSGDGTHRLCDGTHELCDGTKVRGNREWFDGDLQ